jgi:hypothetical protein
MVTFDGPNREQLCSRRERSNTPLQALQLMNDVQHHEAARWLATRMIREGGTDDASRIRLGCEVVLARPPTSEEMGVLAATLGRHRARYASDEAAARESVTFGETRPDGRIPAPELAAYTLVANLLLNLDEAVNRN